MEILKLHFSFVMPNILKDEQKINIVKEEKYKSKDYVKNVMSTIPRFTKGSFIPLKFKGMKPEEINEILFRTFKEGINFDNKTVSYGRRDLASKRLWNLVLSELPNIKVYVDATSNIGCDTINLALIPSIENVIAYEMQKNVFDMLQANIKLYGLEDKITAKCCKFDYKIPKGCAVIVDPPFEIANNADHFNLSIEAKPMYAVVEDILNAGALYVIIGMPIIYKYNAVYASEKKHNVKVYIHSGRRYKFLVINRAQFKPEVYEIVGKHKKVKDNQLNDQAVFQKFYEAKLVDLLNK